MTPASHVQYRLLMRFVTPQSWDPWAPGSLLGWSVVHPPTPRPPHPSHHPPTPPCLPTIHRPAPTVDDRSDRGHSGVPRASDEELILRVGLGRDHLGLGRRATCASSRLGCGNELVGGQSRRGSPPREVLRAKLRDAAPGVAAAASVVCPPFEFRGLSPMVPPAGEIALEARLNRHNRVRVIASSINCSGG